MSLFGKPSSSPQETPEAPSGGSVSATKTVIGVGTRFIGELLAEEDVLVEGRFEGTIRGQRAVTVAATGDVEGDVDARNILVSGKVTGQIIAGERAELTATAVVEGKVQAPKIIIAEGAALQGSVAMSPEASLPSLRTDATSEA